MKEPKVPLTPAQLPQQRIYAVEQIPVLPDDAECDVNYGLDDPLKLPPRKLVFLFQAEWSWSPAHGSIEAFYLHKGQRHWNLYSSYFDDNDTPWRWSRKTLMARSLIARLSERQAAFLLTIKYLQFRKTDCSLDEFHWINQTGFLSVGDLKAISQKVWSD